ncbi:hypothetical protein COLO4_12072 [Corchorus olitorius]|uniref:Uncharacterized protein n=1 Tax=Corchorus olitorius TaxID=93759 RepID=A0A1R3K281_9ROSI|nr:hypothetical protein COLO4_12072 [Corchorus olitorius]
MASLISFTSTPTSTFPSFHHKNPFPSFPISVTCQNPINSSASSPFPLCFAAKSQTGGPVKKRSSPAAGNKKRRKGKSGIDDDLKELTLKEVEIVEENDDYDDNDGGSSSITTSNSARSLAYHPSPLPKPPAGFVVDDAGRVLMASNKRIATLVDPANNIPLECVIRRIFNSSRGDECMLLCPLDMPVQILKSTNFDGWSAVSDEEVESILPAADYALAKVHMHLVHSGEDGSFICELKVRNTLKIVSAHVISKDISYTYTLDGAHYMIYTPSDPLLFVAVKDQNGMLQIADDDLLDDPAIMSTIDEETEFNALVEEEAALLESLLGER